MLIIREEEGLNPTIIASRQADFAQDEAQNLLRLSLREGEQFDADLAHPEDLQITVFDQMDILLHDIERDLARQDQEHRSDREMSVEMMSEKVAENRREIVRLRERMGEEADKQLERTLALLDPAARGDYFRSKSFPGHVDSAQGPRAARRSGRDPSQRVIEEENVQRSLSNLVLSERSVDKRIRRYEVEIHKKFAIPFACLVFILLGAPMAIKTGRGGVGWGISFSLLLFTIYYLFLVGGEELADRRYLDPAVAMWSANVLLLAFGTWLLVWVNRESRPFALLNWLHERRLRREGRA
jgi:lipopolysaccharide export system permease protein